MDGKKDPGKFTVRFNVADPRQREVVDILNRQGRFKAQFLTSAVRHYVHCNEVLDLQGAPSINNGQIEQIVRSVLAEQRKPQTAGLTEQREPNVDHPPHDTDRDSIFRTLEAFQQQ